MPGIYPLKGVVKHYDWGGYSFIPALLQVENKDQQPFAEYWMGTHPQGTSQVQISMGVWNDLAATLPFLFKVLDVRDMLSIQVHPSKEAAEKEFARENAEGIPMDSPHRNYKDGNHKPELMVALSDFWLLHGFKPLEELTYIFLNVEELRDLLPIFNQGGYQGLYQHVMEMPQEEVNRLLLPLVENISSYYGEKGFDKGDEDYWAAKAASKFTIDGNIDRGIFSIYLLNLVHLKKGEGIFQAAGVPHAYLEGQNVEIMANSDNVLRGGLSTKHIDVKELMKHVKCEAISPNIIRGKTNLRSEKIYLTTVPDFELSVFEINRDDKVSFETQANEILLATEGSAELRSAGKNIMLVPGCPAAFVDPGHEIILKCSDKASVFRASTPVKSR